VDGGDYLLGLRRPLPGLFEGIHWSSPGVLAQTLARLEQRPCRLLTTLQDLDTLADLRQLAASFPWLPTT
jgi:glycosyltransferase A (GT-A) superfamily protein (DUF2064 family)